MSKSKQHINEYRKRRNAAVSYMRRCLEGLPSCEPRPSGAPGEDRYPYGVATIFGNWYVSIDGRTEPCGLRSIWMETQFAEKNFLTGDTNRKWNTCFFQTTMKEPLDDDMVVEICNKFRRLIIEKLKLEPPHIGIGE